MTKRQAASRGVTERIVVDVIRMALRGARQSRGETLRQFGREIGVSSATLMRYEHGLLPDVITFLRCVEWLNREALAPEIARARKAVKT